MNCKNLLLTILFMAATFCGFTQNNNLIVKEEGVVVPSVTDHSDILAPEDGQIVFDLATGSFWYYANLVSDWKEMGIDNLGNHTATQFLNLSNNRIINVSNPISTNDAANRAYVDAHEDADADMMNEIQEMTVSEQGDTLYLDGANYIIVPGISDANYIKDGDGNVYYERDVLGQIWLEPSLRSTTYNDGSAIDNPADVPAFWESGENSTPAYMWYDQDSTTYALDYGALYNWFVVDTASNGNKNICPVGYRAPNLTELVQLRDTLSPTNTSLVGHHLKTVGYDYWLPNGGTGNDTYGFAGKGAGRISWVEFQWLHRQLFFMTSSEYTTIPDRAYSGALNDFQNGLSFYTSSKNFGYSIRCIKE